MKFINNLKAMLYELYNSLKRFPVTILLSAGTAFMLILISELQPINNPDFSNNLNRITMTLALGIPLSLCIKLFFERKEGISVFNLSAWYAAGLLMLILYYRFLLNVFDMVSVSRYIGTCLVLYLGFLFIPYFPKTENYELYIIKIFTGFFITVIYSGVLFLGLAAILFTLNYLLSVHIDAKAYYYTWISVACVFAPSYFLSGIPRRGQQYEVESYPRILKILILYIVMPLLSVYTTILYIYFIKIIVTRQWPAGLITNLVLWYSVVGASVLFFITPVKKADKWASAFSNLFPKIIIPVLAMMFISIGQRIGAYGVTENRYYVGVLGLWVLFIMLYYSFWKKPLGIALPVTLSVVAVVSVFGPISSYSISEFSQNSRFHNLLVRNSMISSGKITPSSNVSTGDRGEISRILDYFSVNHSLADLKDLPQGFEMDDMERVLGFTYADAGNTPASYFYFTRENQNGAVDISSYDYLLDMRNLNDGPAGDGVHGTYNQETGEIKIIRGGSLIYEKDIRPFTRSLVEKYGTNEKGKPLPPEDMMLIDENEKVKVKYIFMNISGTRNASTGSISLNNVELYMLVKIK